jgi:hypothetical protein
MALSGYASPQSPLLPLSPQSDDFRNLCSVPLTRQGAARTAISSLRKCWHPPSVTSVSGSCTLLSSYPSADVQTITITVAACMSFPFPFYFFASLLPPPQFAFVLCCHIIFAVCLLCFVSLRVKASLPLVTIAFHLSFSDTRFTSGYLTGQYRYIYISVTYFTLIIRDSLCIFPGLYKDTNVITMGLLR